MGELSAMTAALPSGHFSFPVSPAFTALDLLLFFLFVGSVFVVGPDIFSRLFCARTPRAARRASSITACIMIPLAFAIAFIGIAARFLLPDIPAENAFPALVMHLLPSGFNALVMAALLAVVMSSADTCMLTAGTIVINDVIRPALPAGFPEKALVLLSRAAVLAHRRPLHRHCPEDAGKSSAPVSCLHHLLRRPVVPAFSDSIGAVPAPSPRASSRNRVRRGNLRWLKLAGHEDLLLLSFPVSAVFLFAGSMVAGRLASKRRNIASRQME